MMKNHEKVLFYKLQTVSTSRLMMVAYTIITNFHADSIFLKSNRMS